jgi:hypothetical protein
MPTKQGRKRRFVRSSRLDQTGRRCLLSSGHDYKVSKQVRKYRSSS